MNDLTGSVLAAIEREMNGKGTALVHEVLPVELVERATARPAT
jgi:hypothetical protein